MQNRKVSFVNEEGLALSGLLALPETTPTGRIDRFEREPVLDGNLDHEQKQRMLEIADRCPVHRTLHVQVKVRTVLADH